MTDYSSKQKELDEKKWDVSVSAGKDACGEFDYCAACDKNEDYPCAKAFFKSEKPAAPVKSEGAVKPAAKAQAPKPTAAKTDAIKKASSAASAAKPAGTGVKTTAAAKSTGTGETKTTAAKPAAAKAPVKK